MIKFFNQATIIIKNIVLKIDKPHSKYCLLEIQSETSVQCFGCKSIYGRNSILKHLAKAKRCYDFYSEEDLNSLKEESMVEWKMNVYEWQKEQKGEIAAQKSYRYKFFKKTPTDNPKEEKDDHDEESDDDFKC